jgi:hypothetical protein
MDRGTEKGVTREQFSISKEQIKSKCGTKL